MRDSWRHNANSQTALAPISTLGERECRRNRPAPVSADDDRPTAHGFLWWCRVDVQAIATGGQTCRTAVVVGADDPFERRACRKDLKASAGVRPVHRLATPKSEGRKRLSARAAEPDRRADSLDARANRDRPISNRPHAKLVVTTRRDVSRASMGSRRNRPVGAIPAIARDLEKGSRVGPTHRGWRCHPERWKRFHGMTAKADHSCCVGDMRGRRPSAKACERSDAECNHGAREADAMPPPPKLPHGSSLRPGLRQWYSSGRGISVQDCGW